MELKDVPLFSSAVVKGEVVNPINGIERASPGIYSSIMFMKGESNKWN